MRILVSEIWPVHEECVPAWISALNSLGIAPDVLLNAKSVQKKGSILSLHPSLKVGQVFQWRPTELRQNVQRINAVHYDLIVANSFEGQAVHFYRQLKSHLVGITHNYPAAPSEHWSYIEMCWRDSNYLVFPTVLWSFIEANFRQEISFLPQEAYNTLYPVTSSSDSIARHASQCLGESPLGAEQSVASVPGGLNYQNRDYPALFAHLTTRERTELNVTVDLPGGGDPERLERFISDLERLGISHYFPCIDSLKLTAKQGTPYVEYYSRIFHAHSLLGLFKPNTRYRTHSISSTVPAAINLQRPLFLKDADASLYGLPLLTAKTSADAIDACFRCALEDEPLDDVCIAMRELADGLHNLNVKTLSQIFERIS